MTNVPSRPILFSGPMIQAILSGRKTQTRRMVKPQPPSRDFFMKSSGVDIGLWKPREWEGGWRMSGPVGVARDEMKDTFPKDHEWHCPYGLQGNRLWVRETWQYASGRSDVPVTDKPPCYRADGEYLEDWRERGLSWRPSIFMPRWASRITLEVECVRVERLNSISLEDAIAEGAPQSHPSIDFVSREFGFPDFSRSYFAQLWETINGKGSWSKNPLVWVVEFSRKT